VGIANKENRSVIQLDLGVGIANKEKRNVIQLDLGADIANKEKRSVIQLDLGVGIANKEKRSVIQLDFTLLFSLFAMPTPKSSWITLLVLITLDLYNMYYGNSACFNIL
jgi:hypothetical protein